MTESISSKILASYEGLCEQADQLLEAGEPAKAILIYEKALALLPKEGASHGARAHSGIGMGYLALGDYHSAYDAGYQAYAEKEPRDPKVLLCLGICCYHLHKIEKARSYLAGAYMSGGAKLFEGRERYLRAIQDLIRPADRL